MEIPTFKILLVGDSAVGKTTFIGRHLTGEFVKRHERTLQGRIIPLTFSTNYGPIRFNIVDCPGVLLSRTMESRELHYADSLGAILMFDVTDRQSYKNLDLWKQDVDGIHMPKVVCGNKVDVKDREVKVGQITWPRKHDLQYYELSAKSNHNFEKPFLYLARVLTGNEDLMFTEAEPVLPPMVTLPERVATSSGITVTTGGETMTALPDGSAGSDDTLSAIEDEADIVRILGKLTDDEVRFLARLVRVDCPEDENPKEVFREYALTHAADEVGGACNMM